MADWIIITVLAAQNQGEKVEPIEEITLNNNNNNNNNHNNNNNESKKQSNSILATSEYLMKLSENDYNNFLQEITLFRLTLSPEEKITFDGTYYYNINT